MQFVTVDDDGDLILADCQQVDHDDADADDPDPWRDWRDLGGGD